MKFGRKLRRKYILPFAIGIFVILLPIVFLTLNRSKTTVSAWYNESWAYRKRVPVTNNTSAETSVYINFTGADAIDTSDGNKFQGDCGDLRFTKENGVILPYYIDSGCGTSTTVVHVEFDTLPAGDINIYYYYGNPTILNGGEGSDFSSEASNYSIGTQAAEEKSPGPIAYWKFDEGADNTCGGGTNDTCDITQNRNDGAISNGTAWKPKELCVDESCLFFDGSDDIVTITNAPAIDLDDQLASAFTISMWVKVNSDGEANQGEIFEKGTNTYLRITNGDSDGFADLEASLDLATANATLSLTDKITLDKWHHISLSYTDDGDDEITIYIDGFDKGSSTNGDGSPSDDSNNLIIGGDTSNNYHGFIDEFKIYDKERTAAQIKTDYAQGASASGSSAVFGDRTDWMSEGLVGYWKMDEAGIDAEDETISDSSGNGNDGTLYGDDGVGDNGSGMDCTTAGNFGTGCDFDGTDDYISVANSNSLKSEYVTVATWIKLDSFSGSGSYPRIIRKIGSYDLHMYSFGGSEGRLEWDIRIPGETDTRTVIGDALALDTWYHITATFDGSESSIYINGVRKSNKAASGTISLLNNPVTFVSAGGSSQFIDGKLDNIRIYNRALSAGEIEALYNWAPGPVGYWKMDEGSWTNDCSTDTVIDSSGNGNHGDACPSSTGPIGGDVGKFGKAGGFDGSNDYIEIQNSAELNPEYLTVSAWAKSNTSTWNENGLLVSKRNAYIIHPNKDQKSINFYIYTTTWRWATCTPKDITTWHYYTLTWDGTDINCYIDGILGNTSTPGETRDTTDTGVLNIGRDDGFATRVLNGYIDDVKIYNYARTQKQIISDMNAGHPAPGSPVGSPVLHLKLDEGYGDTAYDSSPQGNHLAFGSGDDAPSWTNSGKFGKALNFDATDDYAIIGSASSLDIADEITLSAWINTNTVSGGYKSIIVRNVPAGDEPMNYKLSINNDELEFVYRYAATTYQIFATSDVGLQTNKWYHVLATYNKDRSETAQLFVNGIKRSGSWTDGTGGDSLPNTGSELLIGRGYTALESQVWDGEIDEVKIYNFALDSDQVKVEYNQGFSGLMGATSTDSSGTGTWDDANKYCPPRSTGSCTAPVGEWDFDENGGTSVYDKSENSNTGTLGGGTAQYRPAWVPGKYSSALDFDGTDDYVSAGANSITGTDAFTLSGWLKVGTHSSYGLATMIGNGVSTQAAYIGYVQTAQEGTSNSIGGGFYGTNYGSGVTGSDWHHVALTFSGGASGTAKIWVDGVHKTTDTYTPNLASTAVYMGKANAGTSYYFVGLVDEVRLYDYERTAAQIAWEYNRGKPVGWWKLDECEGTVAYDSSGNDNNGTITPGAGSNTSVGTCDSGAGDEMWDNGSTGKRNASLDFDGTDDYVDMNDVAEADFNDQDFSISGWFNRSTFTTDDVIIAKRNGTADSDQGFIIYIDDANDTVIFEVCDASSSCDEYQLESSSKFTATGWNHFVIVWDDDSSANTEIYVNGITDNATDTGTIGDVVDLSNSVDLRIASESDGANWFDGQIDEVKIWNYALSEEQVELEYNQGSLHFE